MKKYFVLLHLVLYIYSPSLHSQVFNLDTNSRLKLHLGINYGIGVAGGIYGGGGLKFAPRIGLNYNEKLVIGIESNAEYQIVYLKDSLIEPSANVLKWVGPFVRYYFYPPQKKLNLLASVNYVFGSFYAWSEEDKYRKTYNTAFLGVGLCYKKKQTLIEAGYRYTFLMNNTPIIVKWSNTMFLGLTWNF